MAGTQGPVLFCLHGGGYTGSASDLITTLLQFAFGCSDDEWFRMFHQLTTQCALLCACRLSFALVAGKMKEKVRVVAMDARGHGLSSTEDDSDLSAQAWCLLPLSFVVQSGKFSKLAKIWKRFLLV
jgi:protein phosphatase methylesterase 1